MKISDQVILVDRNDNEVGLMEKEEAHRNGGHLHRASSVMLYRQKNGMVELLLQRRARTKKRWPLFWANTVCTDVRPGETHEECGVRRLKEEMGIEMKVRDLRLLFKQIYKAKYDGEFSEYEMDAVLVGQWSGQVRPNNDEVGEYRWVEWQEVLRWVKQKKDISPWLVKMVGRLNDFLETGD